MQPVLATGEYTMWSATQVPHICARDALRHDGDPGDEAPRHRPGRRRRVRLEAQRLRGRGPLSRPREAARASDQVDRGALGGLPGDHPRPRRPAGDRARGDRRGEDHRRPRPADGGHGRVHAARLAGDSAPRRLALRGLLRRRGLRLRVRRRLHQHDADRRLSRCRPPRGDVRDRAGGRHARPQARHGSRSSSGARTSSPSSPRRSRPGSRSTRATSTPRSTRRSSSPTTTGFRARAGRAARAQATRSSSASASRPTSRCAASPRRGSSGRSATAPAAGTPPRSAAFRPGPSRS